MSSMLSEFSDPRLQDDKEPNDPRLDPDETESVLSDKLKIHRNITYSIHQISFVIESNFI